MNCSGRSERSDRSGRSFRTVRTPRTIRTIRTLAAAILLSAAASSPSAHHGSADYDVAREITITGTVREWRWMQPHTWVVLSHLRQDPSGQTPRNGGGVVEVWSGEGPPLTWAAQRGWSASTLRAGETVSLVMYPSRREARAGLVKRIRRLDGEVLEVSRPWLDRR
jgi:hypothetical protein